MGAPTSTCTICGRQVSKRITVLVEPYGRVCRTHPVAEQHEAKLAELAVTARDAKKFEKLLQTLHVSSLVECIRMMAHIRGVALELVLSGMAWRIPKEIRTEVEQQVRARGQITPTECAAAVIMSARLASEVGA